MPIFVLACCFAGPAAYAAHEYFQSQMDFDELDNWSIFGVSFLIEILSMAVTAVGLFGGWILFLLPLLWRPRASAPRECARSLAVISVPAIALLAGSFGLVPAVVELGLFRNVLLPAPVALSVSLAFAGWILTLSWRLTRRGTGEP